MNMHTHHQVYSFNHLSITKGTESKHLLTCNTSGAIFWPLIILLALLLVGCMTPAQQLQELAVNQQLHEGQTMSEVRQLFGKPKETITGSNGKTLDEFGVVIPRSNSTSPVRTAELRSLYVLYGKDGSVEKFKYHVGETRAYASGVHGKWTAGRGVTLERVIDIQRKVTTRDELIQMFGPATVEGMNVYGRNTMHWIVVEGRDTSLYGGRELAVILDDNSIVFDYGLRNIQR